MASLGCQYAPKVRMRHKPGENGTKWSICAYFVPLPPSRRPWIARSHDRHFHSLKDAVRRHARERHHEVHSTSVPPAWSFFTVSVILREQRLGPGMSARRR